MKPMHLAVVAAALAVGLVAYLMVRSGDDRASGRGGTERDAVRPGGGAPAKTVQVGLSGKGEAAAEGSLAIALTVLDPAGQPAAGAELDLSGRLRRTGGAGADGAARMEGLAPGLYDLVARKGWATGAVSFELKEDRDLGTLRLSQSVALRGTVYDARRKPLKDAVVEATVAGATGTFDLTMMARLVTEPEAVAARARTGEDGSYELLVPKGGRFGLRVAAPGLAPEGEPPRAWTADTEGLDFYLFPGVGLAGRVSDRLGRPVAGARVLLLDPMTVLAQRIPKLETVTDGEGAFALASNPTENIMLVVRATGYATWMSNSLQLPQHDLSVVMESGITLRLRAVRESDPERPAPGVNAMALFRGSLALGVTDADGHLVLENLPREDTGAMGGSDQAVFLWGGGFVPGKKDLPAAEPRDGVLDAGTIELADGGTVRGRVLDKVTGEPVAGAEVRSLGGQSEPELDFYAATTATSREDGTYELHGVPLGAAMILGSHPDYVSALNPMMMAMSRGGPAQPAVSPIFAAGAREAHFDVELTPAAKITGQVVAPDGTPVAGAQVMVMDPMMAMMAMFGSGPQPATTDAEGRFELAGLQRMQAVPVVASHRDWGGSRPRTGRAGGEAVTLELTEPLRLKGRVVDETGLPVEGVRVVVDRPDEPGNGPRFEGTDLVRATRPTLTDAEGRFVVANAPPGDMVVTFDHPEYIEDKMQVQLREGVPEHTLDPFVLRRGATIAGIVLGPEGEPLPNVSVRVSATGGTGAAEGRSWGSARADAEGRFAIHGLAKTTFEVDADRDGWFADAVEAAAGTTDVRLTLKKAGVIRGRVLDGFSQPVAGAQVRAEIVTVRDNRTESEHVGWTRTSADGAFLLRSIPTDRPLTLAIDHDSYSALRVENIRAADHEQLFRLEAGLRVAGIVVDREGTPVANATILVAVKTTSRAVTTAADGSFEAGGLPEGPISMQVQESGIHLIPTIVDDVRPGDRNIRIVVEYGRSIRGILVDRTGAPVTRAQVVATDAQGSTVAHDWLWDRNDGSFELRGLRPGTYELEAHRIEDGGDPEAHARLSGVAAGSTGVRLQLP